MTASFCMVLTSNCCTDDDLVVADREDSLVDCCCSIVEEVDLVDRRSDDVSETVSLPAPLR